MNVLRTLAVFWVAAASLGAFQMNRPRAHAQIERLSKMPPAQRDRALSKLPPNRKAMLEDRLERYNRMTPKQRERLKNDYEMFQKLSPEKQDEVRRSFRQLTEMPEDRRKQVRQELHRLRSMTADERKTRMDSEKFKSRFSDDERDLLANLSALAPAADAEPAPK